MPLDQRGHFAPNALSPDELQQLGRITALWGYIEYQATVILRVCTGRMSKEDMWLIMVGTEVRALAKMLKAAAETDHWVKDEPLRKEIAVFADRMESHSRGRNAHVHAVYGYVGDDKSKRGRYNFKPKRDRSTPKFERITAAGIKDIADAAERLLREGIDLTNRLKDHMKKQRAQQKALKGKKSP